MCAIAIVVVDFPYQEIYFKYLLMIILIKKCQSEVIKQ